MSRRKLFRAAEAMNENPDSRMRTEVDGDWIEFSLEMENYLPDDEVDDFIDCQTYRRLIHMHNICSTPGKSKRKLWNTCVGAVSATDT